MYCAFKVWSRQWGAAPFSPVFGIATYDMCERRVSLVRALGDIKLQVDHWVQFELFAHLDKAADRATVAMASGNQYAMHAAVRSVMPRKPRAYRRVRCADGSPAPAFVAERWCFRAHFAELLEGDEMSIWRPS